MCEECEDTGWIEGAYGGMYKCPYCRRGD